MNANQKFKLKMANETNPYPKFKLNSKFDNVNKKSFWIEIGSFIREHNAINLGAVDHTFTPQTI
jgi:hypothetical protein